MELQKLLVNDVGQRSFLCRTAERIFLDNNVEFDYGKCWKATENITRLEYKELLSIFYKKSNSEFISAIKNKLKI